MASNIFPDIAVWLQARTSMQLAVKVEPSSLQAYNVRHVVGIMGLTMVAALAAGCTTPYEQLMLPAALEPTTSREPDRPTVTTAGLPLSKRGEKNGSIQRVHEGTGEFVGDMPGVGSSTNGRTKWSATTVPPAAATTADGITINLSGASIAEVSKTVLGDVLGVNYSVSEKLRGSITLRTAHPVDKGSLLQIFEAVLRNEGATLVVRGSLYEVVSSGDVAAGGAPLRRTNRSGGAATGVATEIVPLHYVSATEMERVLRSAAPQGGILRIDSSRNLLVLSGTAAEVGSMREMIDVFDVDWMRGMSFGLYPVESADPEAIAKELDTIFANDRESPTKGIVRFIGNRRLKSVLVISVRPEYLRKADVWIARIDKVNQQTQRQVHVYHVQHRPAADLGKLLQKVYSGQGGGSAPAQSSGSGGSPAVGEGARAVSPIATAAVGASGGGGAATGSAGSAPAAAATGGAAAVAQPATAVGDAPPLADGAAADAGGGHSSSLPPDDRAAGISVFADEPNNSLVVTATANEYHRVLRILETLDTQPNQVLLEATIAEVSLNDQLNFGVRWFFQNQANSHTVGFTDATGTIAGPLAGLSYFVNNASVKVLLNALSNVTDVNVLSQPSLMVIENKKATLQVGDEVPILTQTQQTATGATAPTISNAVSYRNTGILLNITPRVGDDGRVLLEVEQEVSDTKSNTTSGIDSPSFQQRRIKTTITVKDGETIVLAGMIQDKATRSRDQVPILGSIPYIGNIFKNKTDTILRTELLIAITPQVIKNSQQISAITSEFRDRLNMTTRPQRKNGPDRREDLSRIIR